METGAADGGIWSPAMVDITLRGANGIHSWFWNPDQEKGLYSVQQLMKIYENSVGRNCNMVIGTVINPDGLVPETDAQRLMDFGKSLKDEFRNSKGSVKGKGKSFMIQLQEPTTLKKYVVQEDIQFGERVKSYIIKGQLENGLWVDGDKGSCIGHKRIGQILMRGKFIQVSLDIPVSKDVPIIRSFEVF